MNKIQKRNLDELAMCAVRYGLGRTTYVSHSIPDAIRCHLTNISSFALSNIVRDIGRYKEEYGQIGWDCDDKSWLTLKGELEHEIKKRAKG